MYAPICPHIAEKERSEVVEVVGKLIATLTIYHYFTILFKLETLFCSNFLL